MTSISEVDAVPKSKKPSDSAFKQQRLPAWQPILTAGTVLPTFFVIGVAFIPVGIGLLYFSDEVKEKTIDYTNCNSNSTNHIQNGLPLKCADIIAANSSEPCFCELNFTLPVHFMGKVYMYYGLTNFYQNHRRYVKSRDDNQLLGKLTNINEEISSDCEPFAYDERNDTKIPIVPCGAIANSLFSDDLTLYSAKHNEPVPLLKTGIAWPSDKNIKFRNPEGNISKIFENFAKPKNWSRTIYQLDLDDPNNNGFQNEDLIVWMRTAALPTFRKLYRRVDHSKDGFVDGLLAGNYTLKVKYSFSVSAFHGKKKMILSTTSLLGGKNPFLGIAYIVVGSLCLLLGIALLIIHIKCSKSTADMTNVTPTTEYHHN